MLSADKQGAKSVGLRANGQELIVLRQIFHFQLEIGTLPGGLKLLVHELRIVGFVLGLERFAQAKQGTWVAGIAIQIGTKDLFGFAGIAVQQQGSPKRLAYREVPVWRFAILESVLNGYCLAQLRDRTVRIVLGHGDLRAQDVLSDLQ